MMVDLSEYERVGDLEAPFELTKTHQRAQEQSEQIRDAVRCDATPLTWEEYVAGAPCPGCGLPYSDESGWESKGTMYFTDEERALYEAEEARFQERHGDCHGIRHSVSGSLRTHCGKCCPMPPLSPAKRQELARVLGGILGQPTPAHELMRWRLRLYCGHIVEKRAHHTHKSLHRAFTGSTRCSQCGLDTATIVDGVAIGLAGSPPEVRARANAPSRRKPSRSELETRVKELEKEIARLKAAESGS